MTRQEQIDSYIAALLATITIANGYQTNAGNDVFRELEYTAAPDVMPSIAWFPGELSSGTDVGPVSPELGQINHLYPMSWEGFVADDLAGTEGRKLKTDLIKALFTDVSLGGLIDPINGCKSNVAVQAADEIFSIVRVEFTILYTTPFGSE